MATVRLNDTIRGYIKNKLGDLFTARSQAVTAEWEKIDTQAIVYKYCAADDLERNRLNLIHASWLARCDTVVLQIRQLDGATINFRMHPKGKVIAPQDPSGSNYYPQCTVKIPLDSPEAKHCFELQAKSKRIEEERDALLKGPIMQAVTECSTLKQLLEVWPTALDFVDAPTRAKHAEKHISAEKKAKAQREVLAIPTDVQVQLITARMTSQ